MSRKISNDRQELAEQAMASETFRGADKLRDLLKFLLENALGPNRDLSAQEIAKEFFRRKEDSRSGEDLSGRARNLVRQLRQKLEAYYQDEGRNDALRMRVTDKTYRLEFVVGDVSPLDRFWAPYLRAPLPGIPPSVLLLFSEPLFFSDREDNYVRNLRTQDPTGPRTHLEDFCRSPVSELVPTYHYYSAGEVNAVLRLMKMFHRYQNPTVDVDFDNTRQRAQLPQVISQNLCVLGSIRTSWLIERFGSGAYRQRKDEPNAVFADGERFDDDLQRPAKNEWQAGRNAPRPLKKYAILTRRPNLETGYAVTLIAANYGRAAEGLAAYITNPVTVQHLLTNMGIGPSEQVPDEFQVLFEVYIEVEAAHGSAEAAPVSTKPVGVWIPSEEDQEEAAEGRVATRKARRRARTKG